MIFSDESLDALIPEFNPRPDGDRDADVFFHYFVTTKNPKQVGTRDAHIGWSTEFESDEEAVEREGLAHKAMMEDFK